MAWTARKTSRTIRAVSVVPVAVAALLAGQVGMSVASAAPSSPGPVNGSGNNQPTGPGCCGIPDVFLPPRQDLIAQNDYLSGYPGGGTTGNFPFPNERQYGVSINAPIENQLPAEDFPPPNARGRVAGGGNGGALESWQLPPAFGNQPPNYDQAPQYPVQSLGCSAISGQGIGPLLVCPI